MQITIADCSELLKSEPMIEEPFTV